MCLLLKMSIQYLICWQQILLGGRNVQLIQQETIVILLFYMRDNIGKAMMADSPLMDLMLGQNIISFRNVNSACVHFTVKWSTFTCVLRSPLII